MRKLVVGTFLTLDGVMQGRVGRTKPRWRLRHGGWSVKYWDEMMGKLIVEQTLQSDALLLAAGPMKSLPRTGLASRIERPGRIEIEHHAKKYVASRDARQGGMGQLHPATRDAARPSRASKRGGRRNRG